MIGEGRFGAVFSLLAIASVPPFSTGGVAQMRGVESPSEAS
jgi:hypothetical protein